MENLPSVAKEVTTNAKKLEKTFHCMP